MAGRICLFTGSFNPPGTHHRKAAEALAGRFDAVHVVPAGNRPDRANPDAVPPPIRAALADIGFARLPRVAVELFDLEHDKFTTDLDLQARFAGAGDAEVWHAVWADRLDGAAEGTSNVQTRWPNGREAWRELRFVVLRPLGQTVDPADLPPRHEILDVPEGGSSRDLRTSLLLGVPVHDALPPRVAAFIDRYSLYTGGPPRTKAALDLTGKKLKIVADAWNPKALEWQDRLAACRDDDDPDAVLALGGDGTMLRVIHENWRLRVPFLGLNTGHLGFLMNEGKELVGPGGVFNGHLLVRRLPMLHLTMTRRDGSKAEELSFNDAWVERATGQTAWVKLSLNGEVRLEKVVCDGVLVSTAAGSTAYAQSMGAQPLLADTAAWLVVGSNVMRPLGWKSALLPMDAEILVENAAPERRPLNGFVFTTRYDDVLAMAARVSRVASVELAFNAAHDMAQKISDLQFGTAKPI